MKIKVYLLNVFGISKFGGNPAGIVLNADLLTNEQKKYISKVIGFSETAFVSKSKNADFKVSFFTPKEEVDFCGHATVATYFLLLNKKIIQKNTEYTQELKAGILKIFVNQDTSIIVDQVLPIFSETFSSKQVQSIFNTKIKQVDKLPIQIVSTGLKDVFLPVIDRKTLFDLKPEFKKMAEFNKTTNTIGFHAFSLDTISLDATAHCRNFAPLYGINEEAATGSSNGALACYLQTYEKLKKKSLNNLIFEQGYSMNKPSEIIAKLELKNKSITRVQVGGKAYIIGKKEIEL